ncbi:F-box/kelch-repeat protein At3g06240-like [Papaver somniferum]|uniref:F-box/kelch-repeat protein At3g06240-like n=1 Tax=Papaver somniferum TaxID=3469 RepID=UPI000E70040F|nr:F-box/kelch-repeat protein At3g06240-like [Papaver somniferum]
MHYPFEYDQDQDGRLVYILGSCNGAICLATSGRPFDIDYRLCIWNPLTREYKRILANVDVKDRCLRCGFGYDSNNEDYRFVRIFDDLERTGYFKAQVYNLKSDSWTIQSIPYLFPFGGTLCPSVLSDGALHWLGVTTTKETNSEIIVSFDISNERFIDVIGMPNL